MIQNHFQIGKHIITQCDSKSPPKWLSHNVAQITSKRHITLSHNMVQNPIQNTYLWHNMIQNRLHHIIAQCDTKSHPKCTSLMTQYDTKSPPKWISHYNTMQHKITPKMDITLQCNLIQNHIRYGYHCITQTWYKITSKMDITLWHNVIQNHFQNGYHIMTQRDTKSTPKWISYYYNTMWYKITTKMANIL